MSPRNFVAPFIVFFLLFSLSAPVDSFSGNMRYDRYFDLEGKILLKLQAGDKGSSPAQHKTLVEGRGAFERDESILIDPHKVSVEADSDWSVSDENLRGLKVGSAVKLNQDLADLSEEAAEQVFAVKVESDPGEEGRLHQDWSASDQVYSEEMGNLFVIDQEAFTSGGTMRRRIDLICPATGVYMFEDSEIEGYAEVIDSLQPADGGEDAPKGVNAEQSLKNQEKDYIQELENKSLSESDAEAIKNKLGEDFYLLNSEGFEAEVPLGTPLEEVELERYVSLSAGETAISGIEVEWASDTIPSYDPGVVGSYYLKGIMHFPDYIEAPDNIALLYTLHVVDDDDN